MKNRLKRNDEVVVICGDDRDKSGRILRVIREKSRVVVEGVAVAAKHIKKSQQYPEGTVVKIERPIHISNVMLKAEYDARRKRGVSQ
ncbi:MAG: 50S ribosomal protein L24 [Puniceicoccales bacterium]|jgi:large subunit ribosomal protein L24|nr:50S ribosomal protein L24 [Puniceicoccales bacterium]